MRSERPQRYIGSLKPARIVFMRDIRECTFRGWAVEIVLRRSANTFHGVVLFMLPKDVTAFEIFLSFRVEFETLVGFFVVKIVHEKFRIG